MASEFVKSLASSKETYKKFRLYFLKLVKNDKSKLLKIEDAKDYVITPYLINFIETEIKVKFIEILVYYNFYNNHLPYNKLVKISILYCFKKIEKNELNFEPF